MNPLSALVHLFESASEERVRLTEELQKLRSQVGSAKPASSAVSYGAAFSDQSIWRRIGEIEKRLTKLGPEPSKPAK